MAEFIEWRNEFSLGIESVDREHRGLADALNQIAALVPIRNTAGVAEAVERLRALYRQTQDHFLHEEGLMEGMQYADLAAHRREHMMLLAELKSFTAQVEAGTEILDMPALASLKAWLLAHTTGPDRAFAAVLHRKQKRGG